MNKIENIIFDFGGVLYNIDLDRSINAFKKLGLDMPNQKDKFYSIFIDLEIGNISTEVFLKRIQQLASDHISENDILHAFLQILVGIDAEKVSYLRKIKEKYNLFLLSNTNEIHYKVFSEEIKSNNSTSDFYKLFKKEYYSHELGLRKPDPEIFNFVLKDSNLDPFGTLFVDDSYENIQAAELLGINTFWIENAESWPNLIMLLK